MLKIIPSSDKAALKRLFTRRRQRLGRAEAVVGPILEAVRKRGDRALVRYARRMDGLTSPGVRVQPEVLRRAAADLPTDFRRALLIADRQVRRYAELQMPRSWTKRVLGGVKLGQLVRPLESVAAYVPGRPISAAFDLDDDGGPRPSGWCKDYFRRLAPAADRNARCRRLTRSRELFPHGRRSGDCCLRVRNRDRAARAAHRRSWKHLRRGSKKVTGRGGGHRFRCGADGDRAYCSRRRPSPAGGRYAGAGRARRRCLGDLVDPLQAAGR